MSAYSGWSQLIKVEQVTLFFFPFLVDDLMMIRLVESGMACMIRLVNNSCHHL